jgi:hypothetical protein
MTVYVRRFEGFPLLAVAKCGEDLEIECVFPCLTLACQISNPKIANKSHGLPPAHDCHSKQQQQQQQQQQPDDDVRRNDQGRQMSFLMLKLVLELFTPNISNLAFSILHAQ